jgi:hypothetical protein
MYSDTSKQYLIGRKRAQRFEDEEQAGAIANTRAVCANIF